MLNLDGHELIFEQHQWQSNSTFHVIIYRLYVDGIVQTRPAARTSADETIRRENEALRRENNLLKIKFELLLDMCAANKLELLSISEQSKHE